MFAGLRGLARNTDWIGAMHTLDSFARSIARPAPARLRHKPVRSGSVLWSGVALCCALMPLGMMVQAYLVTI